MRIPIKKGDICPICTRKIVKPNVWVRFHVKYFPEIVILACKYCNLIENCLRNGKPIPFLKRNDFTPNRLSRAEKVVQYMGKFNIIYDQL